MANIAFTHASISKYYDAKVSFLNLPQHTLTNRNFSSLESFCKHLHKVQRKYLLRLPTEFTWSELSIELPKEQIQRAWLFREYCLTTSLIQVGKLLRHITVWKELHRYIPEDTDTTFTIIGSQLLTSDIDITVQGQNSTSVVALIEDILELLTNKYHIPILSMDIQLYSDFRILRKLFVNVSLFTDSQRQDMLRYAYISYFRSLQMTESYSVSPLARRLGLIYLKHLDTARSLSGILAEAFAEWQSTAPGGHLNREQFYRENQMIERESALLEEHMNERALTTRVEPSSFMGVIASDLFFALSRAHIHRAESYILPSTAVHVVEIEQVLGDEVEPASRAAKWFSDNAAIGVDSFGYLASAIEQLGYLEAYHQGKLHCSKKGVKYFGRLVRALLHAGLLDDSYIPIYSALNLYRKSDDELCPYNIQKLLKQIQTKLAPSVRYTRKLR